MDLTGPIFALIALAWLAYLIPRFLRHREQRSSDEAVTQPFADRMHVVHSAVRDEDRIDAELQVSTPLTRKSAIYQLVLAERTAARRRRRVLAVLGTALVALTVSSAFGRTPWWTLAIPGALIVAFLAVARVTVVRMNADLDRRAARIRAWGETEETICFEVQFQEQERSVEISGPIPTVVGSLWDPVPVTRATYVQKPLAPRTVRTIDLSAPHAVDAVPPIAEGPATAAVEQDAEAAYPAWNERARAVGE